VAKYFIIGFLVFFCFEVSAQSKKKASSMDSVSYYLSNQQFEKAVLILNAEISENPTADRLITRGLAKIELNNLNGALMDLQSSLNTLPKNDTAYYNIGYIHYLQGNYQKSIDYYDSALLYNDNSTYYLIARGDAFLELDNFNLALKDYRQVIALDDEADLGYYGIAMCHFFSDEYDSAKYYLSFAINLDPFDADYYYQRAMCKYILEQEDKLLNDLDLAIDIDAEFVEAKLLRAQIYAENELWDEALTDLNEAYALDSLNIEILQDRGNALINLGEYQKAYRDFNSILLLDKSNEVAYFNRALALLSLDQPQKAIGDFDKAISLNNKDEDSFTYRALTNITLNNVDAAFNDFEKAIELNPFNPETYFKRCLIFYEMEDYELALSDLQTVFTLDPEFDGLQVMMAEVYAGLGEDNLAMKYYDLSIMFEPYNPENFFKRGNYLYELDNLKGALEDFDYAISLDESVPAPYTNRGLLKFELKDKSGACQDWKKAFQLGSEYAQELLKKHCK
jgi:tetratricopeptide (TPR) repeat protein